MVLNQNCMLFSMHNLLFRPKNVSEKFQKFKDYYQSNKLRRKATEQQKYAKIHKIKRRQNAENRRFGISGFATDKNLMSRLEVLRKESRYKEKNSK